MEPLVKVLFSDVGGVLLTNGWESSYRKRAAEQFQLNASEVEARHNLAFGTFEIGKITFDDYLDYTVFYQPRNFTRDDFKAFAFAQSRPFPEMLELVRQVKAQNRLKVAVVSNEGRELNVYRIRKFALNDFIDFFVTSCYVGMRKPDPDMYRLAIDLAQAAPNQIPYLVDRPLLVDAGLRLGLRAI